MQRSFNTLRYPSSSTQMAEFLSTVPKPSIILMVVYHQANLDSFPENAFLSACPNAPSSYTEHESWSVICLYGFGSMPWVTSLKSDAKRGPAVIKSHILLPKGESCAFICACKNAQVVSGFSQSVDKLCLHCLFPVLCRFAWR